MVYKRFCELRDLACTLRIKSERSGRNANTMPYLVSHFLINNFALIRVSEIRHYVLYGNNYPPPP